MAIDNDAGAIDAMLRAAGDRGLDGVTTMVVDITHPTAGPRMAWSGAEGLRRAGSADVCLVAGHSPPPVPRYRIPLDEAIALVYEVSGEAVVEFVARNDPMAKHISASRRDELAPYSQDVFEEHAERLGEIVHSEAVSASRTLYHLRRGRRD